MSFTDVVYSVLGGWIFRFAHLLKVLLAAQCRYKLVMRGMSLGESFTPMQCSSWSLDTADVSTFLEQSTDSSGSRRHCGPPFPAFWGVAISPCAEKKEAAVALFVDLYFLCHDYFCYIRSSWIFIWIKTLKSKMFVALTDVCLCLGMCQYSYLPKIAGARISRWHIPVIKYALLLSFQTACCNNFELAERVTVLFQGNGEHFLACLEP